METTRKVHLEMVFLEGSCYIIILNLRDDQDCFGEGLPHLRNHSCH